MTKPPKRTAAKKQKPTSKVVAKAATNPFLALHPARTGRAGAGLSRGSKRGSR